MNEAELAASDTSTPILPAHIEETITAIAKLHADHRKESGRLQNFVDRLTAAVGQPVCIVWLSVFVSVWVVGNVAAPFIGIESWDAPPFPWLEAIGSVVALYITILILATQRREDQLASYREQLTLELAILSEQKSAKIIALLEEMRRDSPTLKNRVDDEAAAMSIAADPQAVLDAIKETVEIAPIINLALSGEGTGSSTDT